jgi:beta-carotene hydroxylase
VSTRTPDTAGGVGDDRRRLVRAEREAAARYWGGFQLRIVLTFLVCAAAWTAVVVLGAAGVLPLGLGLVLNTVLASLFYMPMHEATHGNICGRRPGSRRVEDLVGMACSIPLGFSYTAHRGSHMRHHAFTNDPDRDPDHYTDGPLRALPGKWLGMVAVTSLLPVFAFVPPARRLLPAQLRRALRADAGASSHASPTTASRRCGGTSPRT